MFAKILIANRGEIACRIIKTCQRLGIRTVAVYSDADADAPHVDMADERVAIGPPPATQSYLMIEKIIAAAKETGADAIHPGYGFLSENPKFAEALDKAGITFIGPNRKAIAAMGDKIESKKLAGKAGVNTVPGHLGVITSPEDAVKIARDIGFPVMIKASAGGGGKGMRIAHSEADVKEGFTSSMNEARSSFGDDRVFIEKFVTEPRHIEIQVLADKHGNVIHLGERECSIQRRNQKVIEEAPSPFLDDKTRAEMGAQAVALAKAVKYDSAGTVEFIVDKDRNFYFLEMNTRLQVEHPVTELVTGIDLVEQMIRSAAGEKLSIGQDQVKLDGWAIESRIYAEDPFRDFLPSIGRLAVYRPPAEGQENGLTIRNDTGVVEGGEISLFYDPMIAKLCTHGPDRLAAIDHMRAALDEFVLEGIAHNIPFLSAVMRHPRFREGRLTTGFIAEEFPEGFQGGTLTEEEQRALIGVAALLHARNVERERRISGQMRPLDPAPDGDWVVFIDRQRHDIHMTAGPEGVAVRVGGNGKPVEVRSSWLPGQAVFRGRINGVPMSVQVKPTARGWRLVHGGASVEVAVGTGRFADLADLMPEKQPPDTSRLLLCPMPGLVVLIEVSEGQQVKAGEPLAVVEAMKMENVLRAERDGTVARINVKAGDSLAVDDIILEFE